MEKNYYIPKSGRLRRKQNTAYFEMKEGKNLYPALFKKKPIDILLESMGYPLVDMKHMSTTF